MNRTFTPELDAGVLTRLEDYAKHFAGEFRHGRQAGWCGVYLAGLLQDGERKSIEPISRRVVLPAGWQVSDPDQALQQFVSASPWEEEALLRRYRSLLAGSFADAAGVFVLDDTTFPKAGSHSVGVQRQYCGALGKKANCQAAVSLHYVGAKGHLPLALRLFLPESWLEDSARLDQAGVPAEQRRALTKGEIALELFDQVRAEDVLPGRVMLGDAGYGVSAALRAGLCARGMHYILGVTEDMVVFAEEPRWQEPPPGQKGRPRSRPRLAADSAPALSLRALAAQTPLVKVTWRAGTQGPMSRRFAWRRVWPAHDWVAGKCAGEEPIWLLIEEKADGSLCYAFSNLPANTTRLAAVRLWRQRWKIEQGYQQMKEELGLDHFEGRTYRGFHHHAALVMLAYGFLAREQLRAKERQLALAPPPRPAREKTGLARKKSRCPSRPL